MSSANDWDESCDFLIVGSGGASKCAALLCKTRGKHALIIEKLAKVGGSTGYSGGVWWVPNNHVMKRAGRYVDSATSVMGRSYPGAGSSIAASFVFGYLAAQHAATRLPAATTRSYVQ
jgi:succinate dehydrogenase/fumarate reductase flavoprotein subunit